MISTTLARWAVQRPLLLTLLMTLVTAGLGTAAATLKVHTSFAKLLPESTEEVKALDRVNEEVGGMGYVVAVIDGAEPEAIEDFAARLATRTAEFEEVRYTEHAYDLSFFDDHALLLLDPKQLEELIGAVETKLEEEKVKANPLIVNLLDDEDEEEAKVPTLEEIEARYRDRMPNRDRLTSADGKTAYVLIKPRGMATDLKYASKILGQISDAVGELGGRVGGELGEGLRVRFTGSFSIRVEENGVMLKDLRVAGLLALLLSVGLVTVWTRRIRVIVLVGAPVLSSVLWTGGLTALFVGEVNIITGFLVAILFGLGIDFGIHLFMRYMEERRHGGDVEQSLARAMEVTGRAAATGAATTAAAFGMLAFAEFEGFSQFGEVAAVGVLIAYAATYVVAPPLYALLEGIWPSVPDMEEAEPKGFESRRPIAWALVTLGIVVAGTAGSLLSLDDIKFVTDFRKLQGRLESVLLQDKAIEDLEMNLNPAVALTTKEDAPKVREAVDHWRETNPRGDVIGSVVSYADIVPDDQEDRLELVEELGEILDDPAIKTLPEEERKKVEDARARTEVDTFGVEDLPGFVRRRFMSDSQKYVLTVIAPTAPLFDYVNQTAWLNMSESVRAAVRKAGGEVWLADENLIAGRIFSLIQRDGPVVLLGALLAVFLILVLDLRHPGRAVLVMAPLCVGLVNIAGVMRLLDVELNFLNSVMVPSIVGIGIDNAVHIYHRWRDEGPGSLGRVIRHTGSAAFLATATTAIGFGTLVVAHHNGLRSVGELALVGMGCAFAATTVFFPALLWFIEQFQRRRYGDDAPVDETS